MLKLQVDYDGWFVQTFSSITSQSDSNIAQLRGCAAGSLKSKVQKKSRLHCSEPEENFALYDVFEEGFEICIKNPVSAKFLYKVHQL